MPYRIPPRSLACSKRCAVTASRSYASLTDGTGNYLQVAGGGVSCMIARFEIENERLRAFHDKPLPVRLDGRSWSSVVAALG